LSGADGGNVAARTGTDNEKSWSFVGHSGAEVSGDRGRRPEYFDGDARGLHLSWQYTERCARFSRMGKKRNCLRIPRWSVLLGRGA
jgi:hypothetical protein